MVSKEEVKPNREPPKPEVKPRQANVDSFWASFYTKHPGTVYNVLPTRPLAESGTPQQTKSKGNSRWKAVSYEEAALTCKQAVEKIVKECSRVNQKYRDKDFDIEIDLKLGDRDCLDGLDTEPEDRPQPKATKRVPDIFTNPQFYGDGASPEDVVQGRGGTCWLIAALGCISNMKGLVERVCVARDEMMGVYGFVFYRDGEWYHTIVDDKLYITTADWWEALSSQKLNFEMVHNPRDGEIKFRDTLQRGSKALYFAKCRDENKTWLPLLQKAYAKAHGDYSALKSGRCGEGVEDLTGGVGTTLVISDILDREKFWQCVICQVNKDFLLSCSAGTYDNWQDSHNDDSPYARSGILKRHGYSILAAVEKNGQKLVKLRNPWNTCQSEEGDFRGDWSDGSKEWTPEMMQELQYRFSDDKGAFWMSYEDMLDKFAKIFQVGLFDDSWTIAQRWTSVNAPLTENINQTEFSITITKETPVVIVLSQLDDRYFQSMKGEYLFSLHLFLHQEGEIDYITRDYDLRGMSRSVNVDLPMLDPGRYSVRMRITASRWFSKESEGPEEYWTRWVPEQVLRRHHISRPEKVLQQGRAYDFAHAKGIVTDSDEEEEEAEEGKPDVTGDVNVTVEPSNTRKDTAAGAESDPSKDTTSDKATDSSTPTDSENASALNTPSSSDAESTKSGDKELDKDAPTLDTNKEPSKEKSPQGDIERQDAELAQNPWNAVCVVGLRVYSKDEKCSIKVIRPFWQAKYVPKPTGGGDKKKDAK